MSEHLIDIAYEAAQKKFKNKSFTFRELFNLVSSKAEAKKTSISDLYVDLISDVRFIYIGKDKWTLSENLKNDDFQKISSSMFGLDKYTIEDLDENEDESNNKKQDAQESEDEGTIIDDEKLSDEDDNDSILDDEEDENDKSDSVVDDIEDIDDDIDDDEIISDDSDDDFDDDFDE